MYNFDSRVHTGLSKNLSNLHFILFVPVLGRWSSRGGAAWLQAKQAELVAAIVGLGGGPRERVAMGCFGRSLRRLTARAYGCIWLYRLA